MLFNSSCLSPSHYFYMVEFILTLFFLLSSCPDIDECKTMGGRFGHHCGPNTRCVNSAGKYQCDCLKGHSRVDNFTCSGSHKPGSSARSSAPQSAHFGLPNPGAWRRWLALLVILVYLTHRSQ